MMKLKGRKMGREVIMTKISSSKKCAGTPVETRNDKDFYTKTIQPGSGMYTFVYKEGSKRTSQTRHMTEQQAKAYKKQLEG